MGDSKESTQQSQSQTQSQSGSKEETYSGKTSQTTQQSGYTPWAPWQKSSIASTNAAIRNAMINAQKPYSGNLTTAGPMEDWLGETIKRNTAGAEQGFGAILNKGVSDPFNAYTEDVMGQAKLGANQIRSDLALSGGLRSSTYGNTLNDYWGNVNRGIAAKRGELEMANRGIQLQAAQGLEGIPSAMTGPTSYLQSVKAGDIERTYNAELDRRKYEEILLAEAQSLLGLTKPPPTMKGTQKGSTSGKTSGTYENYSSGTGTGTSTQTSSPSPFSMGIQAAPFVLGAK